MIHTHVPNHGGRDVRSPADVFVGLNYDSANEITGSWLSHLQRGDDCNREGLAIEVDFNLPARRVVRTLDRIAAERGYRLRI